MAISTFFFSFLFSFFFFPFVQWLIEATIRSENLQTSGNFDFDAYIQEIFEDNPLACSTNKICAVQNFTCIMSIRLNSIYLITNLIGKMLFHLAIQMCSFFPPFISALCQIIFWYKENTQNVRNLFIKGLTLLERNKFIK